MKKLTSIITFILFIPYTQLFAKDFTISGYVKDKINDEPLIGANIFIEGTSIGAAADKKGFYEINGIKAGTYTIKAAYIGYKTFSDTITIAGDEFDIALDFNLNYTTIEGSEVIVTAQAKGQMNAINKQLNSKSLVNIISSDRIQELPDANAAETVARVPGVSIKREGGEGNKVVIRGLSPKYNNITVNGVKLASTDNNDRSTDLSMISQYMLDGIEVTKAGTPDQDADVLGGTVNFLLKKAEPGFHGNIIAQGMYNGLRDTYGDDKIVLDLSQRFWKDRIGILAQIDLENRNRSSHEIGTGYNLYGEQLDSINPLQLTNLNLNDWTRLNDRENRLQVIDINIPNGNLSYSNLNSKINKDINHHNISYGLSTNYRFMTSSQGVNSITVLTESWKYEQTLFKKIHLDAFFSYSRSDNKDKYYDFSFDEPFAYDSSTYDQSIEMVQQIAKNDTSNMALSRYDYWHNNSSENEQSIGYNLQYDFRLSNYISGNFKLGNKLRTKKRTFDRHHEYGAVGRAAGGISQRDSLIKHFDLDSVVQNERRIPLLAFIDEDYKGENFFKGKYSFGAVADLDYMMDVYNFFSKNFNKYNSNTTIDEYVMHHIHQTDSQIYDYSGEENYRASYFMTDIDFGSMINVVAGGRKEINKTEYFSNSSLDHALPHWIYVGDSVSHERKNSYYLPALFLKYKPTPWLSIRYAQTNTLTRPDYVSIIPLTRANGQARTLDWRNKFLEPGLSKNIDLSVSVHEDKLGLVTIGYFQKNIKDLIYASGTRIIFADDTSKFSLPSYYENYRILDYNLNNPHEVILKGWEFDYQARFWYLPRALSGFVFNANYTLTQSDVKYPLTFIEQEIDWSTFTVIKSNIDTTYTDRLLDQPNEIINLSIGYDYKGFSGRLSMLYNDDVFMSTAFWPELRQQTDAYRRWDLSMKQKLPVDGLEIFLNASNLTETNDVNRYRGETLNGDNLSTEQYYGKTIDFGFRYSF
jgi:TonB-dependent receptor